MDPSTKSAPLADMVQALTKDTDDGSAPKQALICNVTAGNHLLEDLLFWSWCPCFHHGRQSLPIVLGRHLGDAVELAVAWTFG
jgi:hypothetical protein